jgi:hypothetical protein
MSQKVTGANTQVINTKTGAEISRTEKRDGQEHTISHAQAEKALAGTGGVSEAQQRAILRNQAAVAQQKQQSPGQTGSSTAGDIGKGVASNAIWEAFKIALRSLWEFL